MRVLIADDSVVYRSAIRQALEKMDFVEIVGVVRDGKECLDFVEKVQVDVLTLDIEMPVLSGLEVVKEFEKKGIPQDVIVLSSFSKRSMEHTVESLRHGALEFIAKPVADLSDKTKTPVDSLFRLLHPILTNLRDEKRRYKPNTKKLEVKATVSDVKFGSFTPAVIVMGSSTGGPAALIEFFKTIKKPVNCPILVAQHMPPLFTNLLAQTISNNCGIVCAEAQNGDRLRPNIVYIAPGDFNMRIVREGGDLCIRLSQDEKRHGLRPSVDVLFESAAEAVRNQLLGIVLTGMGADGKDGALAIKENRGFVLTQDKSSCAVYGMPKAVSLAGASDGEGNVQVLAHLLTKLAS